MATDDEETRICQTLALGALTGALEREGNGLVLRPELATSAAEHPRLYVRIPGILKSEYEVSMRLVPGTALEDEAEPEKEHA